MELRVARGFTLPVNAVTEVISFLATRGAGKSFASAVFSEEFFAASLQFVVVDPMGVYWGLRSSYDGKHDGIPVVVAGGERGDVPLEPTAGRLMADVIVDSGLSFVLDLSLFDSKAEQIRFMEAFAERLFFRKGPIENRTPIVLIVDEADEFAPQRPAKDETKMLAHMIRLAKRGRSRGIGLIPLTQRSAEFNKAILDLSSAVVFMRTAGPRDRKTIKDWMQGAAPELIALVDSEFPKLGTGEALIYSPHWLGLDQPRKVKFRMIHTFDSYKTPEAGEVRAAPKKAADIDLDVLGEQIKATVERAKENDPNELRAEIARLRREVAAGAREQVKVEVEPVKVEVEVPVLSDEDRAMLLRIADGIEGLDSQAANVIGVATSLRQAIADRVRKAAVPDGKVRGGDSGAPVSRGRNGSGGVERPERLPEAPARLSGDGSLPGPQQKILDAIGWFEALGVTAPTRNQVALIAGYSATSGGVANLLSKLSTAGLVHYPATGRVALTDTGRALATDSGLPSTDEEVQAVVLSRLPAPQAKLLQLLIDVWPEPLDRDVLAERAGYSPTSGGVANLLSRLRTGALVDYPDRGRVVAQDVLFPMSRGAVV